MIKYIFKGEFLNIETESGNSIVLTGDHLICEKSKGYIKAQFIKLA